MKGVTRYIMWQILGATVFVTLALTLAIWLSQSLRLIDLIINRGVSFATFLYMSALMLPSFLMIVIPITVFAAIVFVYNRLTTDSELVVMRAAGLSQIQIARPAILVAAIFTVVAYSLTLYFLPATYRLFKDLQFKIRGDNTAVLLQEGVFNTISKGITVYVRARKPDGSLQGILVHDSRDPNKPVTMMAETGALIRSDEGPRVVMINGNRQEVAKEDGRLSLLYFDRYTLDIGGNKESYAHRWRDPRERYLNELFWPSNSDNDVNNYYKLRAEGHQRLVSPLLTLAFAAIALAALLSGDFSRRGQHRRILLATVAMASVQTASLGLQNLATKIPSLVPLMYINAIGPIVIGLALIVRTWQRRPPPVPIGPPAAVG